MNGTPLTLHDRCSPCSQPRLSRCCFWASSSARVSPSSGCSMKSSNCPNRIATAIASDAILTLRSSGRSCDPATLAYDLDGIAETEADHYGNCPVCGTYLEMRDLAQVLVQIQKRRDRNMQGVVAVSGQVVGAVTRTTPRRRSPRQGMDVDGRGDHGHLS